MSKIIIGIDPDSKAHGVAVYVDGKLKGLNCLELTELIDFIPRWKISYDQMEVHMEDVCANNAVFRAGGNAKVNMSIARRLGMVQQSQVELERIFRHNLIFPVKHKISKMWKKDKAQFEKVTGWTGRSNEDTRSAAYFGFLGLNITGR
jgi:hypothetical protein